MRRKGTLTKMRAFSRLFAVLLAFGAVIWTPSTSVAQMYIGFYTGAAFPPDADTASRINFFSDMSIEGSEDNVTLSELSSFTSNTAYDAGVIVGVRAGYWLENFNIPYVGVEAEVSGSFPKVSSQDIRMEISGTANGSTGRTSNTFPIEETDLTVLNVGFNLLARYPSGTLQPYGGVGVGIVNGYLDAVKLREPVTVSIGGSSFTYEAGDTLFRDGKDTSIGLQLIGGVRGFIGDRTAVFVEYKYIKSEFEFPSMQIDYNASKIYGGVEFYFSPGMTK